jgi:hypothetical protein
MSEAQRGLARRLLEAFLSAKGMQRVDNIVVLEGVLRELEGAHRDPDYYVFTIFGEPGPKGAWGWRYEGHHVSLNFTLHDGKLVSSTPQFFGVNPAEVASGAHKGLRTLAQEEDLAWSFMSSLSETQRAKAVLSERAPADILTSNLRKASLRPEKGLHYSDLTDSQRSALKQLVVTFAESQSVAEADRRLRAIERAGWESVSLCWMGGVAKGQGHYYRIQGETFLIELDNTQDRANHVHTVWRDVKSDFGGDPLEAHYRTAPHHSHRH